MNKNSTQVAHMDAETAAIYDKLLWGEATLQCAINEGLDENGIIDALALYRQARTMLFNKIHKIKGGLNG